MPDDDLRWKRALRDGDEVVFCELFHAYHARLCAFGAEYTKSREAARDIVQEVFVNVWEQRERVEIRGTVKSYLYGAVRNRALNERRRKETRRAAATDVAREDAARLQRPSADEVLHVRELTDALRRAIAELPERRRLVFVLHRRHGCTYAEIARILGITPKTVENQIGRALKTLRARVLEPFLSTW